MSESKKHVRDLQSKIIKDLVELELNFANQQFPQFTSAMEGLGVIQEEFDEAMEEIEHMEYMFRKFKIVLRENRKNPCVSFLKGDIEKTILELIQLSAMLDKFQNLSSGR